MSPGRQMSALFSVALLPHRRRHDAAKADMRHAGVGRAAVPGARAVAGTVAVVTEKGTAALHALGLERATGVVGFVRPGGVDDGDVPQPPAQVQLAVVPVAAPFPGVAGHVIKAVAVRRVGFHRRGPLVAVLGGVAPGELTLPDVALRLLLGKRLVAPDVLLAL